MILDNPGVLKFFLLIEVVVFFFGVFLQLVGTKKARDVFSGGLLLLCMGAFSVMVIEAYDQQTIIEGRNVASWRNPDAELPPLGYDPSRVIISSGATAFLPAIVLLLGTIAGAGKHGTSFARRLLSDLLDEVKRVSSGEPELPTLPRRQWPT